MRNNICRITAVISFSLLVLAGCGGGPSDKEVEAAYMELANQAVEDANRAGGGFMKSETSFSDFKVVQAPKQLPSGDWKAIIEVAYTSKIMGVTQSGKSQIPILLTKLDNGSWKVVGGG